MHLRQRRDPRIPRRRMQLANVRVRGQRPDDRVFPPAPANHKYSHVPGAYPRRSPGQPGEAIRYRSGRSWRVWSRRGPTPIALTGAPDSSSIALT